MDLIINTADCCRVCKSKVKIVANESPKTIVDARPAHWEAIGPPTSISAPSRSMEIPIARGSNPNPVVNVVKNTGRSLCTPVWTIISLKGQSGFSFRKTLNVSTRTILLFTIIPARATIPIPVSITLKVCPVIKSPTSTPDVDRRTDDRIRRD